MTDGGRPVGADRDERCIAMVVARMIGLCVARCRSTHELPERFRDR
jgi:hypothetical protein